MFYLINNLDSLARVLLFLTTMLYLTYADHLSKKIGMICSQADACVFYCLSFQDKLLLVALCHVDNTQLVGTPEQIAWLNK